MSSILVAVGATSLAMGALSGWPVALLTQSPGAAGRLRVREPRRILQAHIDWIIMGVLLIAVGAADPAVPGWAETALIVGAVGNPLLFLPIAVCGADVQRRLAFRAAAAVSFAALSASLVAVCWSSWL